MEMPLRPHAVAPWERVYACGIFFKVRQEFSPPLKAAPDRLKRGFSTLKDA
jgi:hypothetical protein